MPQKLPLKAAGGCLCGAIRYNVIFPPGHDFAMNVRLYPFPMHLTHLSILRFPIPLH